MTVNPSIELLQNRERQMLDLAYPHPIIPMCGGPAHETPVQPIAPKGEPRDRKGAKR